MWPLQKWLDDPYGAGSEGWRGFSPRPPPCSRRWGCPRRRCGPRRAICARLDLRLLAERHGPGQSGTWVVYGDGTGIWNHRLQFRVSPSGLDRLARAVESARLRDMPDVFGQGRKWLVRRVAVRAGSFSKQVVQIREGEQSKELRELTDQLFEIVLPTRRRGSRHRTSRTVSGRWLPESWRPKASCSSRTSSRVRGSPGQGSWSRSRTVARRVRSIERARIGNHGPGSHARGVARSGRPPGRRRPRHAARESALGGLHRARRSGPRPAQERPRAELQRSRALVGTRQP